jgi:small subunit ribosomal protein S16
LTFLHYGGIVAEDASLSHVSYLTLTGESGSIASMLKIRLQRVGRTNVPTFRVVLTDSKNGTKSGRFLEVLGSYDPRDDKSKLIKTDRVKYWISKGAQLSGTLHNFLVHTKVIEGKKINVLPMKRPVKKEEEVKKGGEAKAPVEAAPVAEAEAPKEEVKA